MPGIKYPILSAKSLFLSKGKTKKPALHRKILHTGIIQGLRSLKKPSIMTEHTLVEVGISKNVSTLGKMSF